MSFHNRIRLPLYLARPQYSTERLDFTKANGETETLSAVVKKIYQGKTDWIPDGWHEKLIMAINHDTVTIEGEKYNGNIVFVPPFEIDWDTVFETPRAAAKFQAQVTPYDNSNNNCITCETAGQLNLVDDIYPSPLDEGSPYDVNVIENDEICCSPVTFSITSYNADYVQDVSIDSSGILFFTMKTGLVAVNGLVLATYRATCPNGGYDEADLIGDVNGTIPGCLAPTGLHLVSNGTDYAMFEWVAPSPAPDHYYWQVLSNPGRVVQQSGSTPGTSLTVSLLANGTPFIFQVRSQCTEDPDDNSDETASNWAEVEFSTNPVASNTCGKYRIFPYGGPDGTQYVTYLGCLGYNVAVGVNKFVPVEICALQTGPGAYTSIDGGLMGITITYLGIC